MKMSPFFVAALVSAASFLFTPVSAAEKIYTGTPLKGLIVTGGCCHNYKFQTEAITNGISKYANVEWQVVNEGGTGTRAEIDLYSDPNWAKPFDVIIHNECFADTRSPEYITKITEAHKSGKPAMVIHCAMHTYRAAREDHWREFLGVTSRRHDHMSNYAVTPVAKDHPIMRGFPEKWITPKDELYVIEKVWPGTKVLATSPRERNGEEQPVIWVNDYEGSRVFGTTLGHSDDTFRDPVFINLLARGFLWSAGKLK